jgi:hypothetical protein
MVRPDSASGAVATPTASNSRLSLQVVYLWRHVSSTAPAFILWWSNLEIQFGPLHRSSPFIGNSNGTRPVYSRENPKSSLYCDMSMGLPHDENQYAQKPYGEYKSKKKGIVKGPLSFDFLHIQFLFITQCLDLLKPFNSSICSKICVHSVLMTSWN